VSKLTLVSHHLCPYVQRAVIALREKEVPFERIDVDLANKPEWFNALSPLGKTPVLKVGEAAIFESAVILEYLEETQPLPLHPPDPLRRAEHRSWIEFGSATLNDIAAFYSAPDEASFAAKAGKLSDRFAWLERRLALGRISTAASSRWWTPFSVRSSVISMSSIVSVTSASLRASLKLSDGAKSWQQDRQSVRPLRRIMTRGYRPF